VAQTLISEFDCRSTPVPGYGNTSIICFPDDFPLVLINDHWL